MITPGLAFAIAYEPYRLAVVPATEELLARLARNARVMSNPKLKHAVEFATKGAEIEATIAAERANALIARANAKGAGLPALPAYVTEWRTWLENVATHVKPMLPNADAEQGICCGRIRCLIDARMGRRREARLPAS